MTAVRGTEKRCRVGLTPGAGVVDTATWVGSMPAATGWVPGCG